MTSNNKLDGVIAVLGQPAYRRGGVALYQGDCVELLNRLPAESIDLTVTSPPYNIGKAYEEKLSLDDYLTWSKTWIDAVYRTTAPQGAFWLNVGYVPVPERGRAVPLPYLLWNIVPFYLVQEVIWHYGAGVAARKAYSPRNEKFLWYAKDPEEFYFDLDAVRDPDVKYPNQYKNGKLKVNPLGKNPTDVWGFPKVTSGRRAAERTDHPAQFPVAVIDRVIRGHSKTDDILVDPFMGSGSTAEAAVIAGRPVVGFELRSDYIEIAATRLDRVIDGLEA